MAGSVSRLKSGRWRARYREHARHFERKADAQRWVAAQTSSVARGDWIDPALARTTVAEWSAVWLETKAHLRPKTRDKYESGLRIWILPRWGQAQLGSITHAEVVSWVAEIQRNRSAGLTRHTLAILSQLLELAVRDGRIPRNVARGVRRPRLSRPVQRFLSHEEVARLASEAPPPYDVLVILLAFTGLRFGEAAGLTVSDVDLERSRLSINWSITEAGSGQLHRDSPKTYRRRSVPIPAFLRDRLAAHIEGRAPDEPLFTSPKGGLLRNSNFRHSIFDPAVQRAGLAPLTPHNLRDTAASLAVASGANVKSIQRMLGHASAAMTLDVYSGLFDAELDDVATKMHDAAGGAFGT